MDQLHFLDEEESFIIDTITADIMHNRSHYSSY